VPNTRWPAFLVQLASPGKYEGMFTVQSVMLVVAIKNNVIDTL